MNLFDLDEKHWNKGKKYNALLLNDTGIRIDDIGRKPEQAQRPTFGGSARRLKIRRTGGILMMIFVIVNGLR